MWRGTGWVVLVALASCGMAAETSFVPVHVEYSSLMNTNVDLRADLVHALQQEGIVVVEGIPNFSALKQLALRTSLECAPESLAHKTTVFASDNSTRRTFATSVTGSVYQSFKHKVVGAARCDRFDESSLELRKVVSRVTEAFFGFLDDAYGLPSKAYLRSASREFLSFAEILEESEQLEHFHHYNTRTSTRSRGDTIETHTDQGLVLVFTPPMMSGSSRETGTFKVVDAEGVTRVLDLSGAHDRLVFMMGDGVHQYINAQLEGARRIHSVPHSFAMPQDIGEESRLWYGRMVLPPSEAISPAHGLTFRELRRGLMDVPDSTENMFMGCSGELFARELTTVCDVDQVFCWNRCMNFTAIGLHYMGVPLSKEFCEANGFNFLKCINPATDNSYNESGCNDGGFQQTTEHCARRHGSFLPACTNSTTPDQPKVPLPVPQAPCDDFSAFVDAEPYTYKKVYNNEFVVQARVNNRPSDPQREELCFRLTFDGFPGWMAVGFFNGRGKQISFASNGDVRFTTNVMMGAPIVMGVFHDPDYPFEVHEYLIHPSETTFQTPRSTGVSGFMDADPPRGWDTPLPDESIRDAVLHETSCYAEMKFCTDRIGNRTFDIRGLNDFMWGYEKTSTTVSKHSSGFGGITGGVEVVAFSGAQAAAEFSFRVLAMAFFAWRIATV